MCTPITTPGSNRWSPRADAPVSPQGRARCIEIYQVRKSIYQRPRLGCSPVPEKAFSLKSREAVR
jgi:hypothetical protein